MIISHLALQNFRNFSKSVFPFSSPVTLLVGPNTSGKTNLLEAIYLLATGRSFRAEIEREMISYGKEIARVGARVGEGRDLEIILTSGEVAGEKAPTKKYLVNNISKRMIDFLGNLRAVLFWPEDLELVTNSPSKRRKYLDLVLFQVDREYRRSALSYEKGLRQRNKLLEKIKEGEASRSHLLFWDQLLIKNGSVITDKRMEFIEFVNSSKFQVTSYKLEYDKSVISQTRLEQYAQEEVAAGATLVGPHRDDFKFQVPRLHPPTADFGGQANSKFQVHRDLSLFGSRGEQRLAIFWLKLAELEFITQKTSESPILLLDDIFSEFDHEYRKHVLGVIPKTQTIITTTHEELIPKNFLGQMEIIRLTGDR